VGCYLPALITLIPSDIITSGDFVVAIFNKGDVFMKDNTVINDEGMAYTLFNEFIFLGNMPEFIKYLDSPKMYDDMKRMMRVDFHTDRVIFEIIYSHLYRNPDNIMEPYRLTNMSKDPVFVPLRQVQHAAMSTTGKVVGSYFDVGLDSAIVNKAENNSKIEDTLRM